VTPEGAIASAQGDDIALKRIRFSYFLALVHFDVQEATVQHAAHSAQALPCMYSCTIQPELIYVV
jgi:hypothetical protein